ncbi:MAG: superoxide dismutase, Ni [Gammaproteobacteria bacterium]|nr:MAG: superoxide dismutase, Ni [Gammaproteobacteria bacterium]
MLHSLLNKLNIETVSAHCDVPCGIYDTMPAQIYALSVLRFCKQADELGDSKEDHAKFSRLVSEKEVHAEKVKHEIRIIWGDYFKGDLLTKYSDIHEQAHNIMLAGSACKQSLSVDNAQKLVDLVNKFAETFWDSKGVETYRAVCPYAPAVETVYPKLG